MIQFEWKDLAWMTTVIAVVGGVLFLILRVRLGETFVKREDLVAVQKRLDLVEARLALLPDHDDIADISRRMGEVERTVAVAAQQVSGTNALLARVEHQVGLMFQSQIGRSA